MIIIRPPWVRHIAHFWDVLASVWHFLAHAEECPWIKRVHALVLIITSNKELPYIRQLAAVTAAALPQPGVRVVYANDLPSRKWHCFEEAVIPGMVTVSSPGPTGGLFTSCVACSSRSSLCPRSFQF